MKINLGCGTKRIEDAVNVDRIKLETVDVVHDLNIVPWPFDDGCADIVFAYDVLEQLNDLVIVAEEIWRILKPDGVLIARTNWCENQEAFHNPMNRHYFSPRTFDFFDDRKEMFKKYGYYSTIARFHVERCREDSVTGRLEWNIQKTA